MIIAVVGWDSSGTSAVAGVLSRLGIDFGDGCVGFYSPDERGGFGGELPSLVRYCESVAPGPGVGFKKQPDAASLQKALQPLLDRPGTLKAFKFPILCVMVSELEAVFKGDISYVFTCRDTAHSAASVARRSRGAQTEAQALARIQWLQRSRESFKTSTEPIRVQFDELMERPLETVRALADALGIQHSDAQLEYAAGAIDKALWHVRSP